MTRSGSTYTIPRDGNRVPFLVGASSADGVTPIPVEIDPATGRLLITSGGGLPTAVVNGQQTVTTSPVALPTAALQQGVILQAKSTNAVSIFVGGAGVTIATGTELTVGASTSVVVSNMNAIYVVCASGTPVITWLGS